MIRDIQANALSDTIRALCIEANTILPQDLRRAICSARDIEPSPVGKAILSDLVENYEFAESKGLPICQDTGMAVVFLDWGPPSNAWCWTARTRFYTVHMNGISVIF